MGVIDALSRQTVAVYVGILTKGSFVKIWICRVSGYSCHIAQFAGGEGRGYRRHHQRHCKCSTQIEVSHDRVRC